MLDPKFSLQCWLKLSSSPKTLAAVLCCVVASLNVSRWILFLPSCEILRALFNPKDLIHHRVCWNHNSLNGTGFWEPSLSVSNLENLGKNWVKRKARGSHQISSFLFYFETHACSQTVMIKGDTLRRNIFCDVSGLFSWLILITCKWLKLFPCLLCILSIIFQWSNACW